MGISSEFLRRRVLSAIAALAQGEDSARTNLEGAGGSLLYSCSSFIMASWYHFISVLKVILFCTKLKWIIVQVQRRGRPVHLWRKMAARPHPLPRTPTPLLLLRLSSRLSASSAWSERSLFKLTFFHPISFKVFFVWTDVQCISLFSVWYNLPALRPPLLLLILPASTCLLPALSCKRPPESPDINSGQLF